MWIFSIKFSHFCSFNIINLYGAKYTRCNKNVKYNIYLQKNFTFV